MVKPKNGDRSQHGWTLTGTEWKNPCAVPCHLEEVSKAGKCTGTAAWGCWKNFRNCWWLVHSCVTVLCTLKGWTLWIFSVNMLCEHLGQTKSGPPVAGSAVKVSVYWRGSVPRCAWAHTIRTGMPSNPCLVPSVPESSQRAGAHIREQRRVPSC